MSEHFFLHTGLGWLLLHVVLPLGAGFVAGRMTK